MNQAHNLRLVPQLEHMIMTHWLAWSHLSIIAVVHAASLPKLHTALQCGHLYRLDKITSCIQVLTWTHLSAHKSVGQSALQADSILPAMRHNLHCTLAKSG